MSTPLLVAIIVVFLFLDPLASIAEIGILSQKVVDHGEIVLVGNGVHPLLQGPSLVDELVAAHAVETQLELEFLRGVVVPGLDHQFL